MLDQRCVRSGAVRAGALLVLVLALLGQGGLLWHVAGAAPAAATDDPLALLGTSLDSSGCATAPMDIGRGVEAFCGDHRLVAVDGVVEVVSVESGDGPVLARFDGTLPAGVSWHDGLKSVLAAAGRPWRITPVYGTPTLIYRFDGQPYGSLEYHFDVADRLVAISASVLH